MDQEQMYGPNGRPASSGSKTKAESRSSTARALPCEECGDRGWVFVPRRDLLNIPYFGTEDCPVCGPLEERKD